jgi:hypothetical protein
VALEVLKKGRKAIKGTYQYRRACMARIPRIMIVREPTAYHVISRTALDGCPIGDVEKDYFVGLIKRLSKLYFVKIIKISS